MIPNDPDNRPSLLLVDEDVNLSDRLGRALTAHGFDVRTAATLSEATRVAKDDPPEYAVVDLRLPDGSGLKLIPTLLALDRQTRIVMLTGYGSIATAIEAIKLGATYYLTKPVNAQDIIDSFERSTGDPDAPVNDKPMTVERLTREHIERVLSEHNGNVSATARALSMHRRTLQRMLAKRPVRS
jgi:two-component system response regulator RegA